MAMAAAAQQPQQQQQHTPTTAFLGATGGSTRHALTLTLLSTPHHCRALARTPAKLHAQLAAAGVPEAALERLTVIEGDVRDVSAVRRLLTLEGGEVVDKIVFGIGSLPALEMSPYLVGLKDGMVCQEGMGAVFTALEECAAARKQEMKPVLVAISTTGISQGPRDVPWAFYAMYHWFLHLPHVDKRAMETLMRREMGRGEAERVTRRAIVVRASLLTDGEELGLGQVREGSEERPEVGYTISRKDVGRWIFERVLKDDEAGKAGDGFATVTY